MATLTLEGLPEHVYRALEERAAANRRSLNSEAITCLEEAVVTPRVDVAETLARADGIRARIKAELDRRGMQPFTEDEITAAKNEGRP